jgi:hypothetical protein
MSNYFTDEIIQKEGNSTKSTKTTEAELREVFRKIKELLLSVEI